MKNKIEQLKKNWESYILHNKLSEDTRPLVKEAWDRCLASGADYNGGYGDIIPEGELNGILETKASLISIAEPVMENVFEIIKQTSFSLVLTDENGVIIHVIENESIHKKHNSLRFIRGTRWDEKSVGANAIGTALAAATDVHMVGAEHFCISHHPWTCSAALIRNSLGEIIGCIDISGSVEDDHIHTFGIVTYAARIIEKQMDLTASYELIETAMDSVIDGLFVIDKNFRITNANKKILEIFNVDRKEFDNINIMEMFEDLDIKGKVFEKGESIGISDYTINFKNSKHECLLNISPTKISSHVTGAVFFVKEAQQVRKVVSHIAGYQASYEFEDILTENEEMCRIIRFAKKIAKTNSTVLIQGESGTGKELFAHAIHNYSRRSSWPFVAVNCAALPKDLVESELFGYEKGSFTGASREGKPGKFELANGGTIFLDEIGELPLEMQSKLLRVIESNKVNRIGSRYERSIDVRIITATNKNLREEIDQKSFREDLFFRLNVINITLPPLRERKEDIIHLAYHFLNQLNEESKSVKRFSQGFIDYLNKNQWRGNVRELRHCIQREYYLSEDEYVRASSANDIKQRKEINIDSAGLKEVEKIYIEEALKDESGNVIKAAKRLNIGKSTVYRKIKEFNINTEAYK
ncbi:MAG: sigma 54-interacting transcriptional regulator [Eubacteriales bacterium]|nr:sigma 54-interacting transcriptional regulator [Eubacteriales bacterium]